MTFEELKQRVESGGFGRHTGIEILQAGDGQAVGRIVLKDHHRNPIGSVHGGCLFTLMDTVAGTAFTSTGKVCTTLNAATDFLSAAITSKVLTARAHPVRQGNHIAVFDVQVTDDQDVLIARSTVTFYVIRSTALTDGGKA